MIVEPFLSECKFNQLGVEIVDAIKAAGWTDSSLSKTNGGGSVFWWKLVLMPVLHSIGNPMLSEKSLSGLMRRLKGVKEIPMKPSSPNKQAKKTKAIQSDYQLQKCEESKQLKKKNEGNSVVDCASYPKDGWLELRKEYVTYLQNGNLFIFKQSLVPVQKASKQIKALDEGSDNKIVEKPRKKQSNIPLYHTQENSILPLPPLDQVLTYLQKSQENPTPLKSHSVQWGPWQVSALVKPSLLVTDGAAESSLNQCFNQCEIVDGKISLDCHPHVWLNIAKVKKQSQMLPLQQFPCLERPILGEVLPTTDQSNKCDSLSSFSDMQVLMGGKFSYSVLMPLTRGAKGWDWQLSLSPTAKLLPLRLLDTNLRRLIPVVAPTPVKIQDGVSSPSLTESTGPTLYCIVEIEYEFRE